MICVHETGSEMKELFRVPDPTVQTSRLLLSVCGVGPSMTSHPLYMPPAVLLILVFQSMTSYHQAEGQLHGKRPLIPTKIHHSLVEAA